MSSFARSLCQFLKGLWLAILLVFATLSDPLDVGKAVGMIPDNYEWVFGAKAMQYLFAMGAFGWMFIWFHRKRVKFEKAIEEANRCKFIIGKTIQQRDFSYYIEVVSNSDESLSNCLAKISSVMSDDGEERDKTMNLRTENQVGTRPQGNFNLRPGETKQIVFGRRLYESVGVRILGADDREFDLRDGKFWADVHIFSDRGRPARCKIEIDGSKCEIVEIDDGSE